MTEPCKIPALDELAGSLLCFPYLQYASSFHGPVSSITAKKKSFDSVLESRRWRVDVGKTLAGVVTTAERRVHRRRVPEEFFAEKPSRRKLAMLCH